MYHQFRKSTILGNSDLPGSHKSFKSKNLSSKNRGTEEPWSMEKVGKEGKGSSAEQVKHHRRGPRFSKALPFSGLPLRPPAHFPVNMH